MILKEIFKGETFAPHTVYPQTQQNIPADPFVQTQAYKNYEQYRQLEERLTKQLREKALIQPADYSSLTSLNPDYWKAYYLLGEAYWANGQYEEAKELSKIALTQEIPYTIEREKIDTRLKD